MKQRRSRSNLTRRRVCLGMAAGGLMSGGSGLLLAQTGSTQAGTTAATPSDMEGPFYPVEPIALRQSLVQRGGMRAKGQHMVLSGVVQREGKPLAGVRVEIWQCDAQAIYRHPASQPADMDPGFEGYGAQVTDAQGRYQFITLLPVAYGSRPPHIHLRLLSGPQVLLTTQAYLPGQTSEGGMVGRLRGASTSRERQVMGFSQAGNGQMQARFDVVLG